MDPVTAIGLVASLQQLIIGAWSVGQDAAHAKDEMRRLSIELSALKATLEHIQLILSYSKQDDDAEDGDSVLKTTNYSTPEFAEMLRSTEEVLSKLRDRLQPKTHGIKKAWQRLTWHFEKSEVEEYMKRLERAKSWFTLASTSDNVMVCRESFLSIRNIEQTLQSQQVRQAEDDFAEMRASVEKLLAPYDPQTIFREALDGFQDGTGKWLLDDICQDWMKGNRSPLMWLRAKPGFGKTTLMAAAVDGAKSSRKPSSLEGEVAYFFCSFAEQHSQELRNVLGSIAFQLCDCRPSLLKRVHQQCQQDNTCNEAHTQKMDKLSLKELEELMVEILQETGRSYIYVDAINESKDPTQLVKILIQLAARCPNTYILVSSTEEAALEVESALLEVIPVGKMTNSYDLKLYIDAWLLNNERMRKLPEQLKVEISASLRKKAQGVFRWVQCQMATLDRQKTIKDVRSALEGLPSTLEQTYQRILARIPVEDASLAKNTLLWLCFSRRPMRFEEICEAVVLDDSQQMDEQSRLLRPNDLLETCSSLITYSTHTRGLSLAHSSVFIFLTSESLASGPSSVFHLSWQTADEIISQRCLSYLLLPHFANGYTATFEEFIHRVRDWPLLPYTADALWDHLLSVDPHGPLKQLLLAFLDSHRLPRAGNFGSWVQAFSPRMPAHRIQGTTPLYWASREGHLPLVRMILALGGKEDLEKPGGMHLSTPLHVAAWSGHADVVKELLDAGANVHERNKNGESGLHWAVILRHVEVRRLLEEAGARLRGTRAKSWQHAIRTLGNPSKSDGEDKNSSKPEPSVVRSDQLPRPESPD